MIGHRLLRKGADGILKRCVSKMEVPTILEVCHDSACGKHFSGQLTGQKIFKSGYFWLTMFKDSHNDVKKVWCLPKVC